MTEPIMYNDTAENEGKLAYDNLLMPGMETARPSEAALVEKLDPKNVLVQIRHFLKGEMFDESEQEWKQVYKPLCPDEFINKIMVNAAAIVNQNTTMSDLTDQEIGNMVYYLATRIVNLLCLSAQQYNISYENLDTIWENVCDMSFAALKRAKGRGEMKALRTVIRSQESIAVPLEKPQKRKISIFGGGQ